MEFWPTKGRSKRGLSATYPSHHIAKYDHKVLHHVASDCHLLNIVVIDGQIVLVSAIPQHLVAFALFHFRSRTPICVSVSAYLSGMRLSLFKTDNCKLSLAVTTVTKYMWWCSYLWLCYFWFDFWTSQDTLLSCGCCGPIKRPDFARFAWLQLCTFTLVALELNYITTLQRQEAFSLFFVSREYNARTTNAGASRLKTEPESASESKERRRSQPKFRDIASREQSTPLCFSSLPLALFPHQLRWGSARAASEQPLPWKVHPIPARIGFLPISYQHSLVRLFDTHFPHRSTVLPALFDSQNKWVKEVSVWKRGIEGMDTLTEVSAW